VIKFTDFSSKVINIIRTKVTFKIYSTSKVCISVYIYVCAYVRIRTYDRLHIHIYVTHSCICICTLLRDPLCINYYYYEGNSLLCNNIITLILPS